MQQWRVRERALALGHPLVFGILNVTPDSFSDGGKYLSLEAAVEQGALLLEEGADGLDIGGESTRPQGATPVSAEEERRRILPVLAALRARFPSAILSVDTVKSGVAAAAIDAGADIINDVSGLRLDPQMAGVCATARVGLVLMHSRGSVSDMGTYADAQYGDDVVGEVIEELSGAVRRATDGGVSPDAIAIDPGLGFAKRSEHSIAVLRELRRVVALGFPVMVGASRKRFVGELSGAAEPGERMHGSIAANVMALAAGASIFRVHDVRPNRRALDVAYALRASEPSIEESA